MKYFILKLKFMQQFHRKLSKRGKIIKFNKKFQIMNFCRNLCEIIQQIDNTESFALVFDGFDESQNACIGYQNLKNTFKLVTNLNFSSKLQ